MVFVAAEIGKLGCAETYHSACMHAYICTYIDTRAHLHSVDPSVSQTVGCGAIFLV